MPGEPTRLGPFTGGLNTLSDPTSLTDTELVDCVNLELDLDGSLLSRPPIVISGAGLPAKARHLGFVNFNGTIYHLASAGILTYFSTNGTTWTTTGATFAADAMVQFDNKAWLVRAGGAGGYWSFAGGFVAVATMPPGESAVVIKSRLYIVPGSQATTNASRLSWSNIYPGGGGWTFNPATDFVDVSSGDGENLIDVAIINDNLILFKQDSTYAFTFDSGPSTGTLRKVSGTIGATKRDCVALYEQNLYVYHEGNVYEIINYDFTRLNTKVPFFYDATVPAANVYTDEVFLSVVGDRLVIRYYNRIYVFGLRTRTWTRWTSSLYFGPFRQAPVNTTAATNVMHFAGSCISGDFNIFRIDDGFGNLSESMTCSIKTKNYDLSVSHKFKRLFWWGMDISAKGTVIGTVSPVTFSFTAVWNDLAAYHWNQLNTWEKPLEAPLGVTTTVPTSFGTSRRFVKFLKSIRFRQVYFTVSTTTDGTSANAPVRFFTITAMINQKQDVSKAVS